MPEREEVTEKLNEVYGSFGARTHEFSVKCDIVYGNVIKNNIVFGRTSESQVKRERGFVILKS